MADNGQKIIDLDKKRMHAMAQKDIAALNALLSDDLVYTHSSARLDTKQSLIRAMDSGATVYTAVEPSDVQAMVDWCGHGPRGADVESVDESTEEPEGISGFDIR